MKTGQAEKFLKARKDPSFARAMQIKELSPAQSAGQTRLRKVVNMTDSRLSELDAGIASLKRRANASTNKSPNSGQALERIQRSVRNVDVAIRDRQQVVEELSKRVSIMRLREGSSELRSREGSPFPSSPAHARASTPTATPSKSQSKTPTKLSDAIAHGSPTKRSQTLDTPDAPRPSLMPTDAQREAVKEDDTLRRNVANALAGRKMEKNKAPVTLISRATPASTSATAKEKEKKKMSKPSLVEHASVARGPVLLDAVPVPGSVQLGSSLTKSLSSSTGPPPAQPQAQAQWQQPAQPAQPLAAPGAWSSTPAPPTSGPAAVTLAQAPTATPATPVTPAAPPPSGGFGFGSIKLELSPSTFTSTAPTDRTPRGRGGSSSKAHATAPKLTSTPVLPAAGAGGTLFGGVPLTKSDEQRRAPTGFVR